MITISVHSKTNNVLLFHLAFGMQMSRYSFDGTPVVVERALGRSGRLFGVGFSVSGMVRAVVELRNFAKARKRLDRVAKSKPI